ncbi:MinD/ParA family protein [Caldicellulosiruptoraceae bacterium PP1]
MNDQAQNLRNLIKNKGLLSKFNIQNQQENIEEGTINLPKQKAKVISVTSGKGGVGKSNISVNLALALIELNKKVLIIDADLGLSNIEVLIGNSPKWNLREVIYGEKDISEIIEEGPNGLKFISGGSGLIDLAQIDQEKIQELIKCFEMIDNSFDFIIIDTGAGISNNVLSFVLAADQVIVVTLPEPTAITDGYAIIKAIINKMPEKEISLIINRVQNQQEAIEVHQRLNNVIKRFLQKDVEYLGYIEHNDIVSKAVLYQTPVILYNPKCDVSRQVRNIASKISGNINNEEVGGIKRLLNILLKK